MAIRISEYINDVSDPKARRALQALWEALDVEIDALRTMANELRTDHATQKTSYDATETLVEELRTDHLSTGTSYQPWLTEVDGDLDKINDYLHYLNERDGVLPSYGTPYTIATTGAVTLLGAGSVRYRLGGIDYECDLDTTITLEGGGVFDITAVKFCAWRVLIDKYGTVTTQSDVTTGLKAHDSAEIAMRALGKRARTANTVDIAYVTLEGLDAAVFDVGTTNTNHAEAAYSVTYAHGFRSDSGLAADMSIPLAVSANDLTYKHGTIYPKVGNGNVLAVIAAADDVGWTDDDTITASKFGGHLICVDLAGTAIFDIGADGVAGATSLQAYDTSAAAHTALDAVQLALPMCFVVIGRCVVEADASTFTYDTDDIAGTDGTGVFTSETFDVHDRTYASGTRGYGTDAPVIPATVTAPVPTGIGSAAPASGPGSLSAPAVSDSLTRES